MNRYPREEISLTDIIKKSFRLHYLTLKHIILFILIITLVKYTAMMSAFFISNEIAKTVVYFFAWIIVIYLFSAALFSSHETFMDRSKTFSDALAEIKKNVSNIYGTFFGYIVVILCAYALAKLLMYAAYKILPHYLSPVHGVMLIITATIVLATTFMFFYSYPLAVIDSKKIKNAFYDSLLLSDKNKLGMFSLLAILIAVNMLISPESLQEYFLSTYHLGVLYDLVVLCVMIPLFINLLLLLINDAKLQIATEEK